LTYSAIENLIKKFHNTPIAIDESHKILEWLTSKQEIWSIDRIKTADPLLMQRTHPWKLGVFPELDDLEKEWKNLVDTVNTFAQSNQNSPINVSIGEHQVFEFTITKKRFDKLPENRFKFHPNSAKSAIGSLESKEISEFQKRGNQIRKVWSEKQDTYWIQSLDEWSRSCDLSDFPISEFITNWIANVDAEFALARCALEFQLITPTFIENETSSVVLEELRHPIIEQIHTGSPYVRHNISLGGTSNDEVIGAAENGLLVYGSNSSGKSSLMKSLGIAVICAQAGIPVAASKMTISPYTGIFTRILGNDNLWASLSSFAVEMTEFRSILKYSNKKSLVLGDELCSGTETRSATAIVSAGIQTMVKRGSQFLLATHLHEISELEEIRKLQGVKFVHLGIEYNPKTNAIIYKRTLQEGSEIGRAHV
jgi:DNA mismatch repair ATPase MutS